VDLRESFPVAAVAQDKRAVDSITHVRDRPGHDRRYAIDYTKARRELGYAPARNLAQGLRATLDWYLTNTRWWQALLGRDYANWLDKNYER
jgi:dTDP-glucose 4,6-dehydratase